MDIETLKALTGVDLHCITVINGFIVFMERENGYMVCPVGETIRARSHKVVSFDTCFNLIKVKNDLESLPTTSP